MSGDQLENREVNFDPFESKDGELGKAERIVLEIGADIKEGKIQEGYRLPSERDLAARFGVSRMTARSALQTLLNEELIVSYAGRGYFVAGIPDREASTRDRIQEYHGEIIDDETILSDELQVSGSFYEYMKRLGREPRDEFLEQPALVPASEEVTEHLQLSSKELVLKRYRLQLADNIPYRLIESYYPSELFQEILTKPIDHKPLFKWLQDRHGITAKQVKEVLIARPANSYESDRLGISLCAPVVDLERTVRTDTGRIIEWARITASAKLYAFRYEYDIRLKQSMREY